MLDAFIGEIQWVSFDFAPKGWALCNGQLLPINQHQALFAVLGTTYGGNGTTNFALPDLRGRLAIGMGSGHTLGERGGSETVALTTAQMPGHTHHYGVSQSRAVSGDPGAAAPYVASGAQAFTAPGAANATFAPGAVASVGAGQPHENRQPYFVLNAIIAWQGIFPSQS